MRPARAPLALALCLATLVVAAGARAEEPQTPAPTAGDEASTETPAEEPEAPPDPLVVEATELHQRLEELVERADDLERLIRETGDTESRLGLEEQNWRRQLDAHATLQALTENLLRREEAGIDVSAERRQLERFWRRSYPRYLEVLAWRAGRADEARARRDAGDPARALEYEKGVSAQEERLQRLHRASLEALSAMESLGMDTTRERDAARERVAQRADTLAGRLAVSARERDALRSEKQPPESLAPAIERIHRITADLSDTTALLSSMGMETAAYQQLLIRVTGEITPSILDWKVLRGLASDWREQVVQRIERDGPAWLVRGFFFVAILTLFRLLAAVTRRIVQRAVRSARVDLSMLLRETLVSWSSRMINGIGLLVALSSLGLEIGPLLAGLGIAGFIVGFALQDSLSNFAAGAMILAYRPFDVGDVVEASGVSGKVQNMSLVNTTIHTFDNQTLIVPNTRIWGDVIRNVTHQRTRRIDLAFRVPLDADLDRVDAVLREVLARREEVLDTPEPIVEVDAIDAWCTVMAVRPWVDTKDYWPVRWALNREIKQRLDREGFPTPVPRAEVRLLERGGARAADAPEDDPA